MSRASRARSHDLGPRYHPRSAPLLGSQPSRVRPTRKKPTSNASVHDLVRNVIDSHWLANTALTLRLMTLLINQQSTKPSRPDSSVSTLAGGNPTRLHCLVAPPVVERREIRLASTARMIEGSERGNRERFLHSDPSVLLRRDRLTCTGPSSDASCLTDAARFRLAASHRSAPRFPPHAGRPHLPAGDPNDHGWNRRRTTPGDPQHRQIDRHQHRSAPCPADHPTHAPLAARPSPWRASAPPPFAPGSRRSARQSGPRTAESAWRRSRSPAPPPAASACRSPARSETGPTPLPATRR